MMKTLRTVKGMPCGHNKFLESPVERAGGHLLVDVGDVLLVEHVVGLGDLALWVGDDGEAEFDVGKLVDAVRRSADYI